MRIRATDLAWSGIIAASLVVTAVAARRFVTGPPAETGLTVRRIEDGASFASAGIVVGDTAASVKIIEFADFECRFCRDLQGTLNALRAKRPDVTLVYRHFPLSRVGVSFPAAAAAECAAAAGRFSSFADALYGAQDTLSRVDFERMAYAAGIRDTAAFRLCRGSDRVRRRIAEDIEAGRALRIPGTPSLIIGNQLVSKAVSLDELERLIAVRQP